MHITTYNTMTEIKRHALYPLIYLIIYLIYIIPFAIAS